MKNNNEAAEILRKLRADMGEDLIEILLKYSGALPRQWREWTSERCFEYLRCRLKFTQDELSQKSNLAQSRISQIEGGSDALLSTWCRLYAAMGFKLILLPVSPLTVEQLEERAEQGRPPGHWMRQRARPRRRWNHLKQEQGPPEPPP